MDLSLRSVLGTEDAETAIGRALDWVSSLNTGELMQRIVVKTLLKGLTDKNAVVFSCAACQNAESGINTFVLHYHRCVREVAEVHRQTIMTRLEDYVVAYDVFHALVLDHIKIGCGDKFLLMYKKMIRKATQTYYADFNALILARFVQIAWDLKMLRKRKKLFVYLCKEFPVKRPRGRPLGSKSSPKSFGAEKDGNSLPEASPDAKKGRKTNLRSLENNSRRQQSCDLSVVDGAAPIIPEIGALKQESEEKPSEVSTSDSESIPDGEYKVETILDSRRRKDYITGRLVKQYLIKWVDYDESFCTWEPITNLTSCTEIVEMYENNCKKNPKRSSNAVNASTSSKTSQSLSVSSADRTAEMDEIEEAVSPIIEPEVKRDFLDELVRITLNQNVPNVLDLTGIESFPTSNRGVMEEHKMEVILERKTGESVSNAEVAPQQQNLVEILAGWDYLNEIQLSSAQNSTVQLERVKVEHEQSSSRFQLSDLSASAYDPNLNLDIVSVESEENRVNLHSSETVDSGAGVIVPRSPDEGEEMPNLQKLEGESMDAECCCKEEVEEMYELQKCKEERAGYEEGDSELMQVWDSADEEVEEEQDLSQVMSELQKYGEEKARNAMSWLALVVSPKESVRTIESTEMSEGWDPEGYKPPPYSMTYIVKPYDEGASPVHGVFPGPRRNGYHKYVSSTVVKEMLDYNRRNSIPLPRNGAASLEDSDKEGKDEEMNEGRLEIEIQLMEISESRNLLSGSEGQQGVGKTAEIRSQDQEEVMGDLTETGKDQSEEMQGSEANQEARAIKDETENDSSGVNEVGESALEKGTRMKEEVRNFALKQEEIGDSALKKKEKYGIELKAMRKISKVIPNIEGQKIEAEPCDSMGQGREVPKENEEIGDSRLKNEVLQSTVKVEEKEIKDSRLDMEEYVDIVWRVEDGDRLPAMGDSAPRKGAPRAEIDDSSNEEILVVVRVNNQSLRSEFTYDPWKAMETQTGSNQIDQIQQEDIFVDPSESEAEEICLSVGVEDRQVEVADSRQGSHKVNLVPEMNETVVSTILNKEAHTFDPAEEIAHCSNIETVEALRSLPKDPKKLAKVSFSASFMEKILTPMSYSKAVSSGRRGIAARQVSMEPFEESIPNIEGQKVEAEPCDSMGQGRGVPKENEEIGDSRLKNEVLQSTVKVEEEEIKDSRLDMEEYVDIVWRVEDGDRLQAMCDSAPRKGAPMAEIDDSSNEEILVVVRVNNQSLRSEFTYDPWKAMETQTGSNQIDQIQQEDIFVDPSESEAEEICLSVGVEDRQVEVADSRQGSHKVNLVPEMNETVVSTILNKEAHTFDPAEEIAHCSNIETVEALRSLPKDPKKLAKVSFSASFMEKILTPMSYSKAVSSGRRGIAARQVSESMEPFEESIPNCENSSQAKPNYSQVLKLRNPKRTSKRRNSAVINPSIPKPVLTSSKGKSSISKAKKPNSTPLSVKNSRKSNESLRKTQKKPRRVSIDITANSCSPIVRIKDYQQKPRLTIPFKPILKKSAVTAEKITARKTEAPKPPSRFSQPLQTVISHRILSKDFTITPIGKKRLAPAIWERSSSLDGVNMGRNVSLHGAKEHTMEPAPSRKKKRNSLDNNEIRPNPKLFLNAKNSEEIEEPMSSPIATRLRKRIPV